MKIRNLDGELLIDYPGAHLTNANLRGANLWHANLPDAHLTGADLWRANLRGANLTGAIIRHADLRGADLTGANLTGAELPGADLRGADLTDAILPEGQTLPEYIRTLPERLLLQGGKTLKEVCAGWETHTWVGCPMSMAFDAKSLGEVPECFRAAAATFIALFDGGHLPKPEGT